jgi:glycosyltransferase involved in cell wall biosynthesis
VLFSHERLDAILRSRVPPGFPLATAADLANRRLSMRAEHIVVTSGFAAAEFTRIGARNVHRVPLGVDLDTFHPLADTAADPDDEHADRDGLYRTAGPVFTARQTIESYYGARKFANEPAGRKLSIRRATARHTAIRHEHKRSPRIGTHAVDGPRDSTPGAGRPRNVTPDAQPEAPAAGSALVLPAGDGTHTPVRLVLVSRLSREKRPGRAVDALRLLCDSGIRAELTVIGDGPLRDKLELRAADLPVTFRGYVADRNAVAAEVARADIAVCPSPAETFGLAVLEALACGTPVVVPRAGAARELLGDPGSGVECDGTPQGLADGVRTLLTVPADRRRRAARCSAERFPWSTTVAGMLALYADYGTEALSA